MNQPGKHKIALVPDEPGVAANAPDIGAQTPSRVLGLGSHIGVLVENPPSMLARSDIRSSIRFLWAFAVMEAATETAAPASPQYVVTLEQTSRGEPMLCAFTEDGRHLNFGAAPELVQEDRFLERAIELVRREFGISDSGTG